MLHNAPSLEKWMSSVAAQGWIALNRNPYIKRCVDPYARWDEGQGEDLILTTGFFFQAR